MELIGDLNTGEERPLSGKFDPIQLLERARATRQAIRPIPPTTANVPIKPKKIAAMA
jgi:hypothetical protein